MHPPVCNCRHQIEKTDPWGKSSSRKIFEFSFWLKHPKMTTLEEEWGCKCSCPQTNFHFYFPKMPFYSQNCPFIFLNGPFTFQNCLFFFFFFHRRPFASWNCPLIYIRTLNKNPAHKIILVDCIFGTINEIYNGMCSGKVLPKAKLFEINGFFVQLRISLSVTY